MCDARSCSQAQTPSRTDPQSRAIYEGAAGEGQAPHGGSQPRRPSASAHRLQRATPCQALRAPDALQGPGSDDRARRDGGLISLSLSAGPLSSRCWETTTSTSSPSTQADVHGPVSCNITSDVRSMRLIPLILLIVASFTVPAARRSYIVARPQPTAVRAPEPLQRPPTRAVDHCGGTKTGVDDSHRV